MKSYNSSQLLAWAEVFLDRTLKLNVRCWALGSLVSLAQQEPLDPLPVEQRPAELVVDPRTSLYPKFRKELAYLGILCPNDEWENWLSTNASVLGNLPTKYWTVDNQGQATYLSCEALSPSSNKYQQIYISTSNVEPARIDVSSASHLKSVGRIPQLWMFSGEYVGEPSQPISSRVAHYNWLIQSISSITGGQFDFDFPVRAEAFVIGNRIKLDAIRKWFSNEPKMLGGGSDGVAWDIGQRRVLKIFSDRIAYDHALQAVERLHNNPSLGKTEAMIYDLGEIGKFENYSIFYYVMERMAPVTDISGLSQDLRQIVTDIVGKIYKDRTFWQGIKKKDFKADGKQIQSEIKQAAARYAQELKEKSARSIRQIEQVYEEAEVKMDEKNPKEHVVPLAENWLTALAEEVLAKYLTGRTDLHMGNLGVTAYGNFRYFDPAFEGWTSNVNMGGGIIPKAERSEIDWTN